MSMQKQAEKPKKPTEPSSLENKFNLMIRLAFDRRIGRKHMLVYGFILDWWHRGYGDAMASVRHTVSELKQRDPSGKGLFMGDVHSALSDLVEWGYLQQTEKGSGTRASRYVPVWTLDPSVRVAPNTRDAGPSVLETPNASVLESPNAKPDSVLESPNQDPFTRTRSTEPGTRVNDLQDAPFASAGAAAPPAQGADAFEELWAAYGVRREKKSARTIYKHLAPTPEQHTAMVSAANAWRVGAGDTPRMNLGRWLEAENWDCEPPRPYEPRAKRGKVPQAANDNQPASTANWAIDEKRVVTVEKVEPIETEVEKLTRLHLVDDKGARWLHDLVHHREADGYANYGNRQFCSAQLQRIRYAMVKAGHDFTDWPDAIGKQLLLRKEEGFDGCPPNWNWKAA